MTHKQRVLQHAANNHKGSTTTRQNKITVQNCCQLSQANLLDLPKVLPIVTKKKFWLWLLPPPSVGKHAKLILTRGNKILQKLVSFGWFLTPTLLHELIWWKMSFYKNFTLEFLISKALKLSDWFFQSRKNAELRWGLRMTMAPRTATWSTTPSPTRISDRTKKSKPVRRKTAEGENDKKKQKIHVHLSFEIKRLSLL